MNLCVWFLRTTRLCVYIEILSTQGTIRTVTLVSIAGHIVKKHAILVIAKLMHHVVYNPPVCGI